MKGLGFRVQALEFRVRIRTIFGMQSHNVRDRHTRAMAISLLTVDLRVLKLVVFIAEVQTSPALDDDRVHSGDNGDNGHF